MSTSELQQLESLLVRALPDPRGFADRVLGQLLDRLATDSPSPRPVTVMDVASQDLRDRDLVLAAALGACECWGQDLHCDVCEGAGSSGWTAPNEELYAEYVSPAVQRIAATATPQSTNGGPSRFASHEGEQP